MQIHQLKPKHSSRNKRRIGRGGKKGTYSGRGMKGQSSRAGRKMVPMVRELLKKYPKLKGYKRSYTDKETVEVQLLTLDKKCENGDTINLKYLVEKGIVKSTKNTKTPNIKILGNEKITKKLNVEGCLISKAAKESVEKAGGSVKLQAPSTKSKMLNLKPKAVNLKSENIKPKEKKSTNPVKK